MTGPKISKGPHMLCMTKYRIVFDHVLNSLGDLGISQQPAFMSSTVGREAFLLAVLYVNQRNKGWLTENKLSVSWMT